MVKHQRKLFYKIGEVCEICELEPHVLRFWETTFSKLRPVKNRAGHRIYRHSDLELVETIKRLLYEEGYTIAGANARLQEDPGPNHEASAEASGQGDLVRRLALRDILRELDEIDRLLRDDPLLLDDQAET